MSKFDKIMVNGGNNQLGDNNTQNNVTNNHHHHHNSNGQSSNGNEAIPLAVGAAACLATLIWWFFGHINQVYYYLNILTLSSATLSIPALAIVTWSGATEKEDVFRFFGSVLFATGLFGLAILSREYAPSDVIQLSQHTTSTEFWHGLTNHGKNIVISNFIASLSIGFSAFIAHLASLRQLSYSLANPRGKGFWFSLYKATGIFKMRVAFVIISTLSGLAWASSTGKLPSIYA